MPLLNCTGWWEQEPLGRQWMDNLQMFFDGGKMTGQGSDIVGDFEFEGETHGRNVRLVKKYLGAHQIEYLGVSDGEGTYHGLWYFDGMPGSRWMIRVESMADPGSLEIENG